MNANCSNTVANFDLLIANYSNTVVANFDLLIANYSNTVVASFDLRNYFDHLTIANCSNTVVASFDLRSYFDCSIFWTRETVQRGTCGVRSSLSRWCFLPGPFETAVAEISLSGAFAVVGIDDFGSSDD